MTYKLSTWLADELKQRGWSHRELARRSGVSQTAVSQAISEERKVGWDFCAAIARPLDKTPEEVLRLAGLLKETPPAPDEDQLLDNYRRLAPEEQQFLLRLLRAALGHLPLPEITLTRQIITLPGPNSLSPDMEEIMEIVHQLDELERRLTFDYVRWRLMEQEERRNSSGRRHKSKKAKEEEWKRAIEHIELLLAVEESDPERHDWVINHLQRIIEARRRAAHKNEGNPLATTLSPGK